jgi:hypothetical protein
MTRAQQVAPLHTASHHTFVIGHNKFMHDFSGHKAFNDYYENLQNLAQQNAAHELIHKAHESNHKKEIT